MYGYVKGRGHTHWGPGTSMTQMLPAGSFVGMGACESIGAVKSCCDSCAQGGSCGKGLMGCNRGMGLFESGFDFSGWGGVEWAVVIVGGYMVLSTFVTTKRVASRVAAIPGERRKRKAARYRKMADDLTRSTSSKKK